MTNKKLKSTPLWALIFGALFIVVAIFYRLQTIGSSYRQELVYTLRDILCIIVGTIGIGLLAYCLLRNFAIDKKQQSGHWSFRAKSNATMLTGLYVAIMGVIVSNNGILHDKALNPSGAIMPAGFIIYLISIFFIILGTIIALIGVACLVYARNHKKAKKESKRYYREEFLLPFLFILLATGIMATVFLVI